MGSKMPIHTLPYRRAGRHHLHRRPGVYRPPRYDNRYRDRISSPLIWIVGGIILFFFFSGMLLALLIILVLTGVLVLRRRRSQALSSEPTSSVPFPSRSPTREPIERQAIEENVFTEEISSEKAPVYIYPEKPQYQQNVVPTCFACGELVDEENTLCSDCGESTKRCRICRGVIGFGDSMASCPHCQDEFHLSHIQEWLKVAGECPICRKPLKQGNLILGGAKRYKSS